jgi:hypothetical protein
MRIRIALVRFLLEAGFLVLVAVAAGLAHLSAVWIGFVMFCAWLLVAVVERTGARGARVARSSGANAEELAPAQEAEPESTAESGAPTVVAPETLPPTPPVPPPEPEPEPEPRPGPEREPVLVAVAPPEPEPAPEQEPEPQPEVVPLVLRDATPRTWNVWQLERIATERYGRDPGRDEERTLLVLHLREFADASGNLPLEFDPLVREAFGSDLAELSATGLP